MHDTTFPQHEPTVTSHQVGEFTTILLTTGAASQDVESKVGELSFMTMKWMREAVDVMYK